MSTVHCLHIPSPITYYGRPNCIWGIWARKKHNSVILGGVCFTTSNGHQLSWSAFNAIPFSGKEIGSREKCFGVEGFASVGELAGRGVAAISWVWRPPPLPPPPLPDQPQATDFSLHSTAATLSFLSGFFPSSLLPLHTIQSLDLNLWVESFRNWQKSSVKPLLLFWPFWQELAAVSLRNSRRFVRTEIRCILTFCGEETSRGAEDW